VYVSEFDDRAIIEATLAVVEAGHFVIAVSRAESSVKAIEKVIEIFPTHSQNQAKTVLADNLAGIVCQRLVYRVGGGRVPAVEVLVQTQAIKSLIREGRYQQIETILQTSREEGMISLDQALAELVKRGEVSLEEALDHAQDPHELRVKVQRAKK
jgi:twitching motility protein PilT